MILEITVIASLLIWVGIFAGWWLHQMIQIDREDQPKTPPGWHVINARPHPPDRFSQWFRDYPYDQFDSSDETRPPHQS